MPIDSAQYYKKCVKRITSMNGWYAHLVSAREFFAMFSCPGGSLHRWNSNATQHEILHEHRNGYGW